MSTELPLDLAWNLVVFFSNCARESVLQHEGKLAKNSLRNMITEVKTMLPFQR